LECELFQIRRVWRYRRGNQNPYTPTSQSLYLLYIKYPIIIECIFYIFAQYCIYRKWLYSTLTWLTVVKYVCHKWPHICSVCRSNKSILSSFMTYHRVCYKSNTTDATCGAGTSYSSGAPGFTPGFK
jgi:hypothetical protein